MTVSDVHVSVPLKSTGTAYLWWFFLGGLGLHKFYLGRPAMGVLYAFTLGFLGVGVLWDLFTLPSQVRNANRRMVGDARQLSSGGTPSTSKFTSRLFEEAPERPVDADAIIAKYKQANGSAASVSPIAPVSPAAAMSMSSTSARPTFGKKRVA